MNDKQNALEIIRFGKPERVMTGIPSYSIGYHGVNHQSYDDYSLSGDGHDKPVGARWTDIWGVGWHKEYPDVMGFPKINPLADISALRSYSWPDPDDERICAPIYKQMSAFKEKSDEAAFVEQNDGAAFADQDELSFGRSETSFDHCEAFPKRSEVFVVGSHRDTLWEKSYMLVGMENIMAYFFTEPNYAREILHKIMNFQLGIARHYINAGVDMVGLGDDMGTQRSLLFGRNIFDEFLEPEYKRIFEFYKSKNVLIDFHSCGHIEPLLETFISLGVNILNPIQATANDLSAIIRVTSGKMALKGGISTGLLIDGTPKQIRDTVKNTINLLSKGGGYFCCPDQGMPFPPENYSAFENAVAEFGIY